MLPRPRDFTRAVYQLRSTPNGEVPTDADLARVIDEGMPGTAMPGWKSRFSSRDRDDVIAYLKTLSRFFSGEPPPPVELGSPPRASAEGIAEGREVYETLECFKCHGDAGRGDGSSAPTLTDDWDFPNLPADLSENWLFNGGGSVEQIYTRLRTGVDGTPMPSFTDALEGDVVTEEQLWRLAQYVRSLSPERSPSVREVIRATLTVGELPAGPDDSTWASIERYYVPMVGQIIIKPRWFAPSISGLWVQAVHDDDRLALRVTWNEPSRSPDPAWDEWIARMATTMTDVDGPLSTSQGPDRLTVQFPLHVMSGMERPYFLGGDRRRPVHQWRWASAPEALEEGTARGLGTFVPLDGDAATSHAAVFADGQWRLQLTRTLAPGDRAERPTFAAGRGTSIAFFAADGSHGEDEFRGAVSAWFTLHLDAPTPRGVYLAPAVAILLTAGLGLVVISRAQRAERQADHL
jgi:DMSO reductase family type II enzyme heme b subunit